MGLFNEYFLPPGLTVVLRKKFSASNYWKDCCEHNVTVRSLKSILILFYAINSAS